MIILLILCILFYIIINQYNEYFETNHVYTSDEVYQHLEFISDLLRDHNIKHWMMYGTLLGGVRQNDIISNDFDFDIGANINDTDKILQLNDKISDKGYHLYRPHVEGYDYDTLTRKINLWRVSIKVEYKGIIFGDIYLYRTFNDGFMRRFDIDTKTYFWPNSTIHRYFVNKLTFVKIRNRYFPAPFDNEFLLKYWYGSSWRNIYYTKNFNDNSGFKYMKLESMIEFLRSKGIYVLPSINTKIKYVFPHEQKRWIEHNDPPIFGQY